MCDFWVYLDTFDGFLMDSCYENQRVVSDLLGGEGWRKQQTSTGSENGSNLDDVGNTGTDLGAIETIRYGVDVLTSTPS